MSFDPFKGGGDGSSLEHDDPFTSAAKQSVKSVNQQTQAQVKAANQSFWDQVYGNVSSGDESSPDNSDPGQMQQQSHNQQTPQQSGLMQAANPSEQAQLDAARAKLSHMLHDKYVSNTFGEEAQAKRRQEEAEEEQIKLQEEEQRAQEEAERKAAMDESLQSFSQKKGQKGPDHLSAPVAVTQAKTKTEINRGASG